MAEIPLGSVPSSTIDDTDNIVIAEGTMAKKVPYLDVKNDLLGIEVLTQTGETIKGAINKHETKIGDLTENGITEESLALAIKNDRTSLSDMASNWLKGKIINFMGDSITYNTSKNTVHYPDLVADILECTTNNYGISGGLLSGTGGMCDRVLTMDVNAIINVVFGGTNDYNNATHLGTINDNTKATFYGALNILCTNLLTNFHNATNVLMTPLKRSLAPTVGGGAELIEYVRAIQEIGKKYNFLVLNMYDNAPSFNPNISQEYSWSFDGLHPNDSYFQTFFARKIAMDLLSLNSNSCITSKTNALDYEVGSWIPSLEDTNGNKATISSIVGKYEKLGNKITLSFKFVFGTDLGTASGNLYIKGIPFTANDVYFANLEFITPSSDLNTEIVNGVVSNSSISVRIKKEETQITFLTTSNIPQNITLGGTAIYYI